MSSEPCKVAHEISSLLKRLKNESKIVFCLRKKATKLCFNCFSLDESVRSKQMATLIETLNCLYENDVGVLCVYFFNFLELKPLEAIYLPANEPHAYLFGGNNVKITLRVCFT